jgi:energy-coupling factor transporter ATP-binding protein EcfA2
VHFVVVPRGRSFRISSRLPVVVLRRDIWDDFGFKTMFDAHLYLAEREASIELGPVKIMKMGQTSGATEIEGKFNQLDESYCSLGQAFSYYETLQRIPREVREDILVGLRDIAADTSIRESFADQPAMTASLLRFGNAELALRDAISLFEGVGHVRGNALVFELQTSVGGGSFVIPFSFVDRHPLPGRINVIIGYNGCGKTQLIANLANVAHADLTTRRQGEFIRRYGSFSRGGQPRFSSVVAISYSAFDTFDLPGKNQQEKNRLAKTGEVSGYVYCGLRRHEGSLTEQSAPATSLKGIDELNGEILSALRRSRSGERVPRLIKALSPLREEPSFRRLQLSDSFTISDDEWERTFGGLSTGHKLVLNIVVQLVAHLEPGSLVLIDEPESHLHPPLLAALLKSISIVLEEFDSYAIMATHSPVLLQEVPRRYVRVLQRFGKLTQISSPEIETFGENVGLLTRHVFNLDSSATDYHSTLRAMSESFTPDEISELFDGELSTQSRSYLASIRRDLAE